MTARRKYPKEQSDPLKENRNVEKPPNGIKLRKIKKPDNEFYIQS